MARRVIMGSEGPMGQLVYAVSLNVYPLDDELGQVKWSQPQVRGLISIRTSPINAVLAALAWMEANCTVADVTGSGECFVNSDGVHQWTVSIWDMTSMGEERHSQIGSVTASGKPNLGHVKTLSDMADAYMDRLGL